MKEIIIGTIVELVDDDIYAKDLYVVKVDIPGQNKNLYAFPKRSEIDEPRVGEAVLLTEIDPVWHSYYIYEKIKENDFIGIRSRGKVIKFHEDEIIIGIDSTMDDSWYDDNTGADPTPESTSWIKIQKDGTIDINSEVDLKINIDGNSEVTIGGDSKVDISGNSDITVGGDCNIKVSGNAKIESSGNCDINASGSCTINSPDVKITGGKLTVNGSVSPGSGMPFNCVPNCIKRKGAYKISRIAGTFIEKPAGYIKIASTTMYEIKRYSLVYLSIINKIRFSGAPHGNTIVTGT